MQQQWILLHRSIHTKYTNNDFYYSTFYILTQPYLRLQAWLAEIYTVSLCRDGYVRQCRGAVIEFIACALCLPLPPLHLSDFYEMFLWHIPFYESSVHIHSMSSAAHIIGIWLLCVFICILQQCRQRGSLYSRVPRNTVEHVLFCSIEIAGFEIATFQKISWLIKLVSC